MALEQRHLSPEQIQKAAPGIVKRLMSLGFTAVEKSIDEFHRECTVRGFQEATRTKFINKEVSDKRYDIEISLVPDDTGDVTVEYRYQFYDRPGKLSKLTQRLMDFNPLTAITKIVNG